MLRLFSQKSMWGLNSTHLHPWRLFMQRAFCTDSAGKSQIMIPASHIRNFCIIAHIDHGKSTLADRLLQLTNTIPMNSAPQYLDKLKVQRERGITVQAQTATMEYTFNNEKYLLNLVDTPGHVDFNYEVKRSMRSVNGALLLVDVTKGVQAQTMANYDLALKAGLVVIPVLNKIDTVCELELVMETVRKQLALSQEISCISAKTGLNVNLLLERIVRDIPAPPVGLRTDPLKLFLFNSYFINGKNVICQFYVMGGQFRKGMTIVSCAYGKVYQIFEVGVMQPEFTPQQVLSPGQVGYALSNIKVIKEATIGDTFYKRGVKVEPQSGFEPPRPVMFAGIYPIEAEDFGTLEKNLEKLVMTDPAVTFVRQSSATLGNGFRCGFLGMLHMDVFTQRLKDQYDIDVILTSPGVPYRCKLKSGKIMQVESALEAPERGQVEYYEQPYVRASILAPSQHAHELKDLIDDRRCEDYKMEELELNRCRIKCRLPLAEIVTDFVDNIKSITHGYGSFEYEPCGFYKSAITKMVIHIMNDPVDALSFLIHEKKAYAFGKQICLRIKETVSPQLFTVSIQARIGPKTIAAQTVAHLKKHVTAKCYGGDYSRKKKLLQRYKEGKKKLKALGKVKVGKETFLHVMKREK